MVTHRILEAIDSDQILIGDDHTSGYDPKHPLATTLAFVKKVRNNSFDARATSDEMIASTRHLRQKLVDAHKFEVPSIVQFPLAPPRDEHAVDVTPLPFPTTLFQMNFDLSGGEEGIRSLSVVLQSLDVAKVPPRGGITTNMIDKMFDKFEEQSYDPSQPSYWGEVVVYGSQASGPFYLYSDASFILGFDKMGYPILTCSKGSRPNTKNGAIDQAILKINEVISMLSHFTAIKTVDVLAVLNAKAPPLKQVDAPEKLNKKRARAGKPLIDEHKVLDLYLPREAIQSGRPEDPEKKGSPRTHWRRGHLRRLQSDRFTNKAGQTIWIPATLVNPGADATLTKDYVLHPR